MEKTKFSQLALAAAALSASFVAVGAAQPVASFARIEGVAVVSKGSQYIKAQEGTALMEGDRLMVMEGGKAIISFKDGCQHELTDNEILTIGGKSTCASEGAGSYKIQPAQSAAIGGGAAAANAGAALAVAGAVATAVVVSVATEEDDPEDKLDQLSP